MKTTPGRYIIRTDNGTVLREVSGRSDSISLAERFFLKFRQTIEVFDKQNQKVIFTRKSKVLQEWS